MYFTVDLDRLYKIRKKYRCVPNVISQILLSPVVWKDKMAEDDIAFLLNREELVELHEINQHWKVKMAEDVVLDRLCKIRKKYRCVPNVISQILLSPVFWKDKMAEDDRGELVEPHEIK